MLCEGAAAQRDESPLKLLKVAIKEENRGRMHMEERRARLVNFVCVVVHSDG